MKCADVLTSASSHLQSLSGHIFDLLTVSKPISPAAAVNLSKVISKLSPLLGNLIEFNTVEFLNDKAEYSEWGKWRRQDPGFPDTVFDGKIAPLPGFEIKAWFPLATEITARFKDSQNHFLEDQTNVCLLAWIPDQLIFGKPRILDVCVISGRSVAEARDNHYHNPPDYLVFEPGDTTARTRNLQQTNTNGYKWQGSPSQLKEAEALVSSWGPEGLVYKPGLEYQLLLQQLISRFPYRLDTNFAKMDRVAHPGIEAFKRRVLNTTVHGLSLMAWNTLLCSENESAIAAALESRFNIKEENVDEILE